MNTKKLLIIDDEENMRHMLEAMLKRYGYRIALAADGFQAAEILADNHFDFILCDVRMPGEDGLAFLRRNQKNLENTTVIMMSAYGTVDLALEAMKAGAYDFISKPFKSDEVLLTLKKAEEREQLKEENRVLKLQLEKRDTADAFAAIIGENKELKATIDLARKAALYDTTVLLTGESGTGKELFARGIHAGSPRRNKPFFAVNCGSIPANLLESELFGYVKGAFTGADGNKKGLFEEADKSTLFLDEIGELPLLMQVKLLRVLQENEIRPVGATAQKKVDVRIIAATAAVLEEDIRLGKFREDLFYRLNVLPVHIPPLRRRREDIPALCLHFVKKYNQRLGCSISTIKPSAMEKLLLYRWPGNVRELENVIQRGVVLSDGMCIEQEQLPQAILAGGDGTCGEGIEWAGFSLKDAQKQLEATFIRKALAETGGNKSRAALLLEISYPSLLSKIKEYIL